MVRRRLNKKVALIGSAVFIIFALGAILVIFQFNRDPQEFIKDGEAALQAAHETTDEKIKEQDYDRAERSFRSAYGRAKNDTLRQEILFKMVDMYLETQKWPFIVSCWDEIIRVNPDNVKARYDRLRYYQILGDSGINGVWQEVCDQVSDLLEIAENQELLMEDTTQWDVHGIEQKEYKNPYLGPYLFLLRGRALLEMASTGAATNRDEVITEAINDLEMARKLDQSNIDVYWYLARAVVTQGEINALKGSFEERQKAFQEALTLLEQAVEIEGNNPRAQINLLNLKLLLARNNNQGILNEQIKSLETEYKSLLDKFNSEAEVFAAASNFYSIYSLYSGPNISLKNLNNAIETSEKAMELDTENVIYGINSSDLYYRRFSIYKNNADMQKAVEIATKTLILLDAQDVPGPRSMVRKNQRFVLNAFLANCYIEQILQSSSQKSSSDITDLTYEAEKAVHEIEMIVGSNEEPLVIKWQGMLELAKGNRQEAIKKLYSAYTHLKALKPSEPPWQEDLEFAQLSYTLAKIFKDTPEIGAVHEFLISAHYSGIGKIKPEARLDYIEVVLKLKRFAEALQNINAYEEYFGSNDRSDNLRIRTYIAQEKFEDAEKELAKKPENDVGTFKLSLELIQAKIHQIQLAVRQKNRQKELDIQENEAEENIFNDNLFSNPKYVTEELKVNMQKEVELLNKLLQYDPNEVDDTLMINICRNFPSQTGTEQITRLIDNYLKYFPDDINVKVYKEILAETKSGEITKQRYNEIEEQILSGISKPIQRDVQLGIFYHKNNELEKAADYFKKALEPENINKLTPGTPGFEQIVLATRHLFDIALINKDWETAEKVINQTRDKDIDECHGMFFESRLSAAQGKLEDALIKLDECLKNRPIFSLGYVLRSKIYTALGNDNLSVEDIRKAVSLNPLDGAIAKEAALILYNNSQKSIDNKSPEQIAEIRNTLERAISLNPGDLELLNLYVDLITPTEPTKALAIRQDLQSLTPSMENALMLGNLATELALKENRESDREGLFNIANSAFEQAREIDPKDKQMLFYYTEYLRARGWDDKARELLKASQDNLLLSNHYFQEGDFEKSKEILEQLYKNNPKDNDVIRGLLLLAEKTNDQEAVKKYSEELIALNNNMDNQITQIGAFLTVGLVREAEYKLQSFKERYPNESRSTLLEAWLSMRKGQLEKALELTNKSLQQNADNPVAWKLRGEINLSLANYEIAIRDLRKSKTLLDEVSTRLSLSKAYIQSKRYDDAIAELKNTIDAPGSPPEARLLLENTYLQLNRNQALNKFYEETLEKFPDNVQWLNKAGSFAIKTGDFNKAEELFKKAYLIRKNSYIAQEHEKEIDDVQFTTAFDGYLKALLSGAGEPNTENWKPEKLEKVMEECKEYLNSSIASLAYLRMAEAMLKIGDKQNAIEYCQIAVDKTGLNESLANEVFLRMYLILGADEVLKYCKQKLLIDPDSLAANFTMYNLSKINNDYDNAIKYIDKCIELTEQEGPRKYEYIIKKSEVLILAYEDTSDNNYLKIAITDYKSLLSEMPNNIKVLNNLAYMLAENNQELSKALDYSKRVLDAKPNDPGFLDTHAYVLHKNNKNKEAAEVIETALQQYSKQGHIVVPAVVYEHKGMIKEALGAKSEALTAYQKALEIGADRLSQAAKERIGNAIKRVSQE